jgi:hypothetical protein
MDTPALRLNNTDFTVSAWVYETERNVSYQDAILTKRSSGSRNGWFYSIRGNAENTVPPGVLYWQVSGGGDPYVITSDQISLNSWYHVLVTYENNKQKMKMYIDGVFNSEGTVPSPNANTTSHLFIGKDSLNVENRYFFHGKIDDIHIHRRALTECEIKSLYTGEDECNENELDHFLCYKVKPSGNFKKRKVLVHDQFGTMEMQVIKPNLLCTPAALEQ